MIDTDTDVRMSRPGLGGFFFALRSCQGLSMRSSPERGSVLDLIRLLLDRMGRRTPMPGDQSAWILRNSTSVDRPSDRQVVMPVNHLFLAGVMRAFPEQFDGVFAFGF
jgi:hypothetical protein